MLTAVLDDEIAQESGRRTMGERESQHQVTEPRPVVEVSQLVEQVARVTDVFDHPAVEHQREQDQTLVLGRRLDRTTERPAPGPSRPHEQFPPCRCSVRVGGEAVHGQLVADPLSRFAM